MQTTEKTSIKLPNFMLYLKKKKCVQKIEMCKLQTRIVNFSRKIIKKTTSNLCHRAYFMNGVGGIFQRYFVLFLVIS